MPAAVVLRTDISSTDLRRQARREKNTRVACRMLAIAGALDGMSRAQAAHQAGLDRQTLRDWAHRFNAAGVDGLRDRPHTGRRPRLDADQRGRFKALVIDGPDIERDGVSSWTAKDLCRLVDEKFGVSYSENGMLTLLKSLDLSWQKTRPIHPKADPEAREDFKKKFAELITDTAAENPHAEQIEVWFQDEARIGQTGRNCHKWHQRGVRPTGVKDQRHEAVYLFGAACPERDTAFGLVLPIVSTAAMQTFLDELSRQVADNTHAIVIMDRAGWHCAKDLVIPDNLTPIFLPPYSPELNAIERLWLYLKERFLSHRLWPAYEDIVDAVCRAWNRVLGEPGRIKSLCSLDWAQSVKN